VDLPELPFYRDLRHPQDLLSYPTMATDPYHAVREEIQTSLQAAATLRSSYVRIRSTAREDNEELSWSRNEVLYLPIRCTSTPSTDTVMHALS
jgi:hypothetical protein